MPLAVSAIKELYRSLSGWNMEPLFSSSCLEFESRDVFYTAKLLFNNSDQELLQNSWAFWHFLNSSSSELCLSYKIKVRLVLLAWICLSHWHKVIKYHSQELIFLRCNYLCYASDSVMLLALLISFLYLF